MVELPNEDSNTSESGESLDSAGESEGRPQFPEAKSETGQTPSADKKIVPHDTKE